MNYTIVSNQEGLITNNIKTGWVTLDVGCTTSLIAEVIVTAFTAKFTECVSGYTSEVDRDLYGDDSFQQAENILLQQGSIFSDIFPNQEYGINCSEVSSDATTLNLTGNQTARLACAVYLQKTGSYVEVVIGANETSFQNALSYYQLPYKFTVRDN